MKSSDRSDLIRSQLRLAAENSDQFATVQEEKFEASVNFNPLTVAEKIRLKKEFGISALQRHGLSENSWLPENFERDQ